MPFRNDDTRPSPLVPHSAPVDRREFDTPSAVQTIGAAFRQENDVLNAVGWLRRPTFKDDPTFDALAATRASRFAGEYFPELVGTRSQAEFAAKEARIQRELKDKQILAQAGTSGFLAAMAAGTLSPTVLIPAMGPARGLKGAVQAFALAATGAAISEGTLYATQETRTLEEVALGVGAGTVLGGLMGTAARYLTPDEAFRGEMALRAAHREELSIRLPDGEEVPLLEEAASARAVSPEGGQESVNATRTFVANDNEPTPDADDVFWDEIRAAGRAPDGSDNLAHTDPELYELLRAPRSAASPDSSVQLEMIRKAIARGRMDIAKALADRMAREARRASEAVPGVPLESPRYETVMNGLKERANELREYVTKAEELIRETSQPELLELQAGARQMDAVDANLSGGPALSRTADEELPEAVDTAPLSDPLIRIDPDKPDLLDTRDEGVRYHGSRNAVDSVEEGHYASLNYYGNGFYSTDAVSIGHGYAGGRKGFLYEVVETQPVRALDMEGPVPDFLRQDIELPRRESSIERMALDEEPTTLRELFDKIREISPYEGVSADGVQEIFEGFYYLLRQNGFNALDHVGGLRTDKTPHKVRIYLEPETTIRLKERSFDEFAAPKKAPDEGAAARADMAPSPTDRAIPETRTGTDSVGAAVANPRNYGGLARPASRVAGKAFGTLSRLSPITRLMVQDFSPTARYWTSMVQNPGLRQAEGPVNAAQGTLLSRRQIHQAKLADFIVQLEDAYWRHIYGDYQAPPGQKVDILGRLQMGTLGVPPGKLSYQDFGEAVFDTLNTGKAHSEGAVNTAAKVMDDVYDYYRTVARDYAEERSLLLGEDVKPLFEKDDTFLGQGIQNYVTHAFDKDYIVRNADEFLRDFSTQGDYLYRERFAGSFARYRDRRAGLERMRSFAGMTPEQLTDEWDRLQMRKEDIQLDLDYQQSFNQLMQDRRAYRAKLVEEGAPDLEKAVARFVREQQKTFPDRVLELEKERKQLVRLTRHLEGLGANAELQRSGLYEKVMELQRLQNGAFERIASQTAIFARKMDRLGKKVEGGDVKRVLAGMDKELAQLRKREAAIDLAAEKKDGLRGWKESAAWAKKMRKVESLRERLAKAEEDQLDAPAKGLILEEAHHWAVAQAREANYLRALREEKVLAELDELSPEALAAKGEAEGLDLDREIQNLDDTFHSRWEAEGAQGDILEGKADFTDAALEDANELYRRLTGAPDRAVGMELVGAKRGAQLARVLSMPYETKRKYLIRDPEQVLRRYGRTMDSDLELWRVTGSVNGAKIFDEIKEDFAARRVEFAQATHILPSGGKKMAQVQSVLAKVSEKAPVLLDPKLTLAKGDFVPAGSPVPEGAIELTPSMREAYSTLLSQQEKAVAKDMSVVIDRLRHDRGYAADTNATGYRLGRFALNAQVTMMMGKVVLSSLSDVQRPWAKYGIGRTISKGWAPFIQNATFRKTLMESDRRKAIGLDPLLHNRAQAFADVYNTAPVYGNRAVGKVEKGMELLANKTGLVALFDYWTAMNKHVASSITQVEMADNIAVVMGRVPSNEKEMAWAKKNLQRIGVSDDLARRIDYQMQLPDGGTDLGQGMRLPNTDAWDDPSLVRAYAAVVNNEVDNLIITPGLDLPNMADENMGYRLLLQFKSFTFAATTRVHMSMLQGNDPYAMQYALGSLAMGALSYYTWAMSAGGKSWEDAQKADPGTVLYEALDRSGLTGVASLGTKVGEQIPGLSDYWIFGGEERTSRRNSDLISAVLGPTASSLNRAAQIAMEANDPTQSTLHKARGFVPYNNHFLLDRLLDKLEGWAYDAFDVPESRKDK